MRRLSVRVPLSCLTVVLATTLASCGGGLGNAGDIAERSVFWGIPFVPSSIERQLMIGVRNLDDDGTSVALQGYKPDGTPYSGPFFVNLDGLDETHVAT